MNIQEKRILKNKVKVIIKNLNIEFNVSLVIHYFAKTNNLCINLINTPANYPVKWKRTLWVKDGKYKLVPEKYLFYTGSLNKLAENPSTLIFNEKATNEVNKFIEERVPKLLMKYELTK